MGKFEYGLIGVMAFLILGILGMIAMSDDSDTIELKERMDGLGSTSEPKQSATISLGGEPLKPEQDVTIGETLTAEIQESEPEVMEEPVMEEPVMEMPHTHEVIAPEGSGVPGCEETNECYIPYSISIKTGHAVVWINEDTAAHTVTSGTPEGGPDGVFDSGLFLSGATFEHTFDESGSYDYFCMVHPWMTGIIEAV